MGVTTMSHRRRIVGCGSGGGSGIGGGLGWTGLMPRRAVRTLALAWSWTSTWWTRGAIVTTGMGLGLGLVVTVVLGVVAVVGSGIVVIIAAGASTGSTASTGRTSTTSRSTTVVMMVLWGVAVARIR